MNQYFELLPYPKIELGNVTDMVSVKSGKSLDSINIVQYEGRNVLPNSKVLINKNILFSGGIFLFSLAYATTLALFPIDIFKDRLNYLTYAENSLHVLFYNFELGILATLANEPVWLLLNSCLESYFEPQTVLRIIIFFSAFLVSWNILKIDRKYFIWVVCFLLLPQIVKNHIVHLRQGVAIAIFLSGWYAKNRGIRWFLLGVTPFIHASFAFVLFIYYLSLVMKKLRFAVDIRTCGFLAFSLAMSLSLGWLAAISGARQAGEYSFAMADISGLGFVFWFGILAIMYMEGKTYLRLYAFEIGGLLFYLVSYWFVPVTARIFESMILLILVSGLSLTGWRRTIFLFAVMSYGVLQYVLRINQPFLGFGI